MKFNTYELNLLADLLENRIYQLEEREELTEKRYANTELQLIYGIQEKMTRRNNA